MKQTISLSEFSCLSKYTRLYPNLFTIEEVEEEKMEETKREPSPVAPEFTENIENQSLTEGDKLILKCAVRGIPDPTVEWFVNGQVSLVPTLKI